MLILAIETSCDETSAAVLRAAAAEAAAGDDVLPEVLSNVVLSQDEIHAPYGGVVPELASRQHIKTVEAVVREALHRAGAGLGAIDLFAVTQGPGLIGSLLVGLTFAKSLAYYGRKPVAGIDHLEAHLEAVFLENREIPYPLLGLLVSGGHTSLYFMAGPLQNRVLGKTRDDAAGEALDKVAKFLGLGYPGGPVVERLGQGGDAAAFPFALPRTKDRSLDFSFSGLKTAALRHIRERGLAKDSPALRDFLASFEEAVVRALLDNLAQAAEDGQPQGLILCGGVARNRRLRSRFQEYASRVDLPAFIPSPKLCTDNAAMVAAVALKKFRAGLVGPLDLDLDAYARRTFER